MKFRGFSIIELIVAVAIILILTAVVLNGQRDFNKSLTITDTAYTIALTIRQAQTFGLSSHATSGTNKSAYGTHFDSNSPKGYTLFADLYAGGAQPAWCPQTHAGLPDDKPGDCLFDLASETRQTFTFGRGFYISKICGHWAGNPAVLYCSSDAGNPLTSIDFVFLRPNTDSILSGTRSGIGYVQLNDASVEISAPNGEGKRSVCVSYAGQVSVASSTCP